MNLGDECEARNFIVSNRRLNKSRFNRSHRCCRGYAPGSRNSARARDSTQYGTGLETFVLARADRRQVTTTRVAFSSRRDKGKKKGRKKCTAALDLHCESSRRARPCTRARLIAAVGRATALSLLHSRRGRRGRKVMRRQRYCTGTRAVRRYFCIITDPVPSLAGHHGGEVQGTCESHDRGRQFPPTAAGRGENANVATDS